MIAASDVLVMPGQPSPLAIRVKPEQANEKTLVSITGIPEGARLNAGVDAGGGNWLLPPRRLDGLTINVPPGAPIRLSSPYKCSTATFERHCLRKSSLRSV